MSQRCDIDAAQLTGCMEGHTAAIEERAKTPPPQPRKSIEREFIEQCKSALGLAKPRSKNLLVRFFLSFGSLL
jgi:hypothetical protein